MKAGSKTPLISFRWIFLGVLGILLSCNGQKKASANESEQAADNPLTLVMRENYAGTDTVVTQVIENQKSLAKFFAKINRTRKPGIPVPIVDFSKNMVVVYCSGNAGNGAQPVLNLASETETELVLGMSNKKEGGTSAMVSPFSIYTIPLTTKKVRFKAVE